jgi:predicted Zn-dependent protease
VSAADLTAPHQLVEQALAASTADGCIVIAEAGAALNLRWANNTLTTNGLAHTGSVTVISLVSGSDGVRSAAITRSAVGSDGIAALVADSEAAARASVIAEDAAPLIQGDASDAFAEAPADVPVSGLADVATWLGSTFESAASAGQGRFGYAERGVSTVYLGTSTGLRQRHVQPAVRLEMTGRSDDGSRSAWAGQSADAVSRLDLAAIEGDIAQRLEWSKRRLDLEAGRYDTVLPPSAVADLLIYMYFEMSSLDAFEGSTVFSKPGGGTRVGERLADLPLTLRSDPAMPGQVSAPFAVAPASSRLSSVFDNGLPLQATAWISDGTLAALPGTRFTSATTGLPVTPAIDNLELTAPGGSGSALDLIGSIDRGLLLTCLWYVRVVDPQTLLLTGLTRDGVFLVEGGEVVGVVNNFRFNDSPVGLLRRITAIGDTVDTFAREFGDYFTRTRMPALRVADFNMSSVSQAM